MGFFKLTVIPSPPDPRDWKAESIYPAYKLPPTLDLRPEMMPIRDQENQGSCAAMAGSAMKEWQELKDVELDEYLSPQFIYNLRKDPEKPGMYMRDLMNVLQKRGDCREDLFEYGTRGLPSMEAYDNGKNYVIENYARVSTIEDLKKALNDNGPAVIAVPVYNYSERMWYKYPGDTQLGGHAMAVVGYNEDGFIIRNSWGEFWGKSGYTLFPYDDWGCQWEIWTTIDGQSFIEPEDDSRLSPWSWIGICVWGLTVGYIIYKSIF